MKTVKKKFKNRKKFIKKTLKTTENASKKSKIRLKT